MNENYLSRLFQRETGERFSQYLMRVRMETAKQLIESNPADKLYEISEKAGFGDNYHYFSLAFKKYTGLTPSEYKKLNEPSTGSC
jgi:two-component system response regulator YesN